MVQQALITVLSAAVALIVGLNGQRGAISAAPAPTPLASVGSGSVLYIPLIGITSVPDPLSLPLGEGKVTYRYAVKNFLREFPLTDVHVVDDNCSELFFLEGDDNVDHKLDFSETWRFTCTKNVSETTRSTVTATGVANQIQATHKAYATVVVGSETLPPLVSIVNITKVSYPLSLPVGGGRVGFTYRVNNPGAVALSDVVVTDNMCGAMSGRLGDTNANGLLDINEVWIYSCATTLKQTTTSTAHVVAFANGLEAQGEATLTVRVQTPYAAVPNFPETGGLLPYKFTIWSILAVVLVGLVTVYRVSSGKHMDDVAGSKGN